jgi:hypothetical protein
MRSPKVTLSPALVEVSLLSWIMLSEPVPMKRPK